MINKKYAIEVSSHELRLKAHLASGTFGHTPQVNASYGHYRVIGSVGFDGEKNYGEIGPIKDYFPDYNSLRARSWQMYLESEIAQTVLNNHIKWVIGAGLKLQSEPQKDILKQEGISINAQEFSKAVEGRFRMYCKSRMSDYADMRNLNWIESEAYKNSIIGGDVLVILRYVEDTVKVELIDGQHIQTPMYGSDYFPLEQNGTRIVNGIEINDRKQHVAYYVRKDYRTMEYERVPARGTDSDALMAFMVYGSTFRLDNYRGLPILSVMFETAKKLERYKEAVVGSAEERQKIAYFIKHEIFSTGEDPLYRSTLRAREVTNGLKDGFVPRDDFGNELADKVAVSTGKQTINMPLGSSLEQLESKNELYFKEFYETNIMLFCAAAGIPYEVAMSRYDSNYSASRGAIKDWEHKLTVGRANFSLQFMQPIYDFWLEVQILQGKIKAPGYMKARIKNDRMALEAFRNARFVGPAVPHIDPVKEVEAERLKLGTAGAAIPLTTTEQAMETLGGGDSDAATEQFAQELEKAKKLGIKDPLSEQKPIGGKPAPKPVK
jgi:lambda family phage portal protein